MNAGLATRPIASTDDEIVDRFRDNAHFRIGYMESGIFAAREAMEHALRQIPHRLTNADARKTLIRAIANLKRAEALAARADAR